MKVIDVINSASSSTIKVNKSVQRLLIEKSDGNPFNAEMINVKLNQKGAEEKIIANNIFIRELIPFAGFGNESAAVIGGSGTGTNNRYVAVVEIAPAGIPFGAEDEIVIDLLGLTSVACTYSVYAVNGIHKTSQLVKYVRNVVSSGQTSKDYVTDAAVMCAIQDNATRVTLITASGDSVELEPAELRTLDLMQRNTSYFGLTDNETGSSPLYVNDAYYLLDLSGVERVIVNTAGNADCAVIMLFIQSV